MGQGQAHRILELTHTFLDRCYAEDAVKELLQGSDVVAVNSVREITVRGVPVFTVRVIYSVTPSNFGKEVVTYALGQKRKACLY